MHDHARSTRIVRAAAWLAALTVATSSPAAILQIDARISAEVEEFELGQPTSSDSAFEEFRTTAVDLPIQVTAAILPPVEEASSNAFGALAISDFSDPTLSPSANPEEFGVEANVFSLDPFVSFESFASGREQRLIFFSPDEVQAGPTDQEREIESSVFVSGAMLIWTLDPTRNLSGLSASIEVSVSLDRGTTEPELVFSASATALGRSGGEIDFTASGGIEAEVGGEELLTEAVGPSLAAILQEELAGLGTVNVVLIPQQELTYRYVAPINEQFDLSANFAVRSANLPAGTGAGVVAGRSFEDLARIVAEFIGNQSDGTVTQQAINKALADLQEQDLPPDDEPTGPSNPTATGICGMLGMELFMLPLAALSLRFGARRRG